MNIKDIVKSILSLLHIDLTKNMEYDRYTKLIMKKVLKRDSNCIDIGCHKGEILKIMIDNSPKGTHFGFEPIPYLYKNLEQEFKGKAKIYPYALSNKSGESTFQHVINAPAYSGIIKRKYDIENPEIEEINVKIKTLDDIFDKEIKIDLIKIDVEGGEFDVIKGGEELLLQDKPTIIFESGLGASEFYGTKSNDIFNYIVVDIGLNIYTLKGFVNNSPPLSSNEFNHLYETGKEYYFIANN